MKGFVMSILKYKHIYGEKRTINYIDTFDFNYNLLISHIKLGQQRTTRGTTSIEQIGTKFRTNMNDPILRQKSRKLNYRFMAAEALWILKGRNDTEFFTGIMENIKKFSDDGILFNGAYGPKIIDQLPYVISCFKKDIFSRQAIINIWREKPGMSKDIPCTLSIQFLFDKDYVLNTVVSMRSSDIYLGLPYDCFNFSALSAYVISLLKYSSGFDEYHKAFSLGDLYLTAGSMHAYLNDIDKLNSLIEEVRENSLMFGNLDPEYFHVPELHEPLFKSLILEKPADFVSVLEVIMNNGLSGC